MLTAEGFRQFDGRLLRGGVRWEPTPAFSVDLSLTRALGGSDLRSVVVGFTWAFERRRRASR